jgi:Flp pilus assembly protein TadD
MESAIVSRPCFRLLLSIVFAAITTSLAQGPNGMQQPELHGQVERSDGSPFRDGALVKIENGLGGMAAQVASGFRDASADVDLESVPRASIRLTLREATSTAPAAVAPKSPGDTVSVTDLTIPPVAQVEFEKGRTLIVDKHKPADSVKSLLKAIQIAPNYPQAHFLLGTAYMDLAKWSDAESALSKAISFNDKLDSAYLALGSCLIEEKKFAEAEKPLLRGLELFPEASQGHYDLGRAYYALNRFPEAETHARRTLALEPDLPEAHLLLGNVLLRLRNGPDALEEFQEYLRLAPNGPFAIPAKELVKKLQAALPDAQ